MSRDQVGTDRGVVFECQNEPAVADDQRTKLTVNGIAAIDYGTGWTWDLTTVESNSQKKAERAFELMRRLDAYGGYGVVYTENFNDVAIGRVTPDCIYYDKIRVGPGNEDLKKFKTVRFDEWAVMERKEFRQEFDDVHQAFLNKKGGFHPNHIKTMETLEDESAVTEAFVRLDLTGRLQKRK